MEAAAFATGLIVGFFASYQTGPIRLLCVNRTLIEEWLAGRW